MAPEIIRGEHPTFQSDIWSLGVTAIELAEGTCSVILALRVRIA